jgi:steroid delta-isomerase-like uncharacterized protein
MDTLAVQTVKKYYSSFNNGKMEEFFAVLTEDVSHGINQGKEELGKQTFRVFMDRMNRHYKEKVVELVVFANETGTRAAAEFFIEGSYLTTDAGLPEARGQKYRLRCGAFFDLKDGKISRITNYYNLNDWLAQVNGHKI